MYALGVRGMAETTYEVRPEDMKQGLFLCAWCSLNMNAAFPIRVMGPYSGMSLELVGKTIRFPSGHSVKWTADGMIIPTGSGFLTGIAGFFGQEVRFTDAVGNILPMFAVTQRNGTLVCEQHNADVYRYIREGAR